MLKSFAQKYHLVLKKGQNVSILWRLTVNKILQKKLRLMKWIHGIHHPVVHYYSVCRNEEKMLPFVFGYHDQFVDHFIFYDNYSDDQTETIVKSHRNTDVIKLKTNGIDDLVLAHVKNNCWKRSRGKADFVIVCDVDEFAYHPNMDSFLRELMEQKASLPVPVGYNMYSDTFPEYSEGTTIMQQVRNGVPDDGYSKCLLFDPHRVVEINYDPGAHFCHPVGQITRGGEYKVLHYKNLDVEAVLARTRINAARLSQINLEQNLGYAYLYPEERIRSEFEENLQKAKPVVE